MGISPFYIALILVLGVLIFGKNLPQVARQIGSGLMEFKKGLDEMKSIARGVDLDAKKTLGGDMDFFDDLTLDHYESIGTKFDPPKSN